MRMRSSLAVLPAALAGCGFQLRGTADLPFETLYVPGATGGIALDLKRNIQLRHAARAWSTTPKGAEAHAAVHRGDARRRTSCRSPARAA